MGLTKRPLCRVLPTLEEVPFYLNHSAFKGPLEQTLSSGKKKCSTTYLSTAVSGFDIQSVIYIGFVGQKKNERSKTSKSRLFSILWPTCLVDRRWLCLWQRREGTSFSPHCMLPSLSFAPERDLFKTGNIRGKQMAAALAVMFWKQQNCTMPPLAVGLHSHQSNSGIGTRQPPWNKPN